MSSERHETVRLEDYLRVLKERAWVIIACVLVVFVAVMLSSMRTTPLYSASAEIQYDTDSMNTAVFGYQVFGYDYDRDRTIQRAISAIGRNMSLAEAVKDRLVKEDSPGADLSAESISGMVSAAAQGSGDTVGVSATSPDPDLATAVANAFAEEFIAYRLESARALIQDARTTLAGELQRMSPAELELDYGMNLQDRTASLRAVEALQKSDFSLLTRAAVPGAPFTPQTQRDVALAIVFGLVVGVGLAFLLEYLDKRIKDEQTLERISGLPVLASVPIVGRTWSKRKSTADTSSFVGFAGSRSPLLEPFRTLRSALQYFNVDGQPQKILVTSGLPQEGKTVTTVNLAISLAMSGKRVIVLEADLRRPRVHEYFGIANEVGLSNILAGSSSVRAAMQLVSMDDFIPARSRRSENESVSELLRKNLYCITSGPLPPNPTELLQSVRMAETLDELGGLADYLLVDSPPVLPVSDAVALAPSMDAVIIAGRLRSTRRDELGRVCGLLKRSVPT